MAPGKRCVILCKCAPTKKCSTISPTFDTHVICFNTCAFPHLHFCSAISRLLRFSQCHTLYPNRCRQLQTFYSELLPLLFKVISVVATTPDVATVDTAQADDDDDSSNDNAFWVQVTL